MKFLLALGVVEATTYKILCLHGGGESPTAFANQQGMEDLEAALGVDFEFVYATGGYSDHLWIPDPPSKGEGTTDPDVAATSVAALDAIVAAEGPFFGLLGYSQGGAFATAYLAQAPVGTFAVALVFCGYLPTTHHGLIGTIEAASPFGGVEALFYIGARDSIISEAMSLEAAAMYAGPTVLISPTGFHTVPVNTDSTFAAVVSFIQSRAAMTAPPPPTETAPTLLPTAAPSACADSTTWSKKNSPSKDCAWVAKNAPARCAAKDNDGIFAFDGCLLACGACGQYCIDSTTWTKKGNVDQDCSWVKYNYKRCNKKDNDGVYAFQACKRSCQTCDTEVCTPP